MYSKIQIKGKIEVETGMHIGGSGAFAAIGAVDSPVVKDSVTNLPMIPGSSLKGKMRTLLAKAYNTTVVNPDNDDIRIKRLFGCAKKGEVKTSRIIFSDMIIANADELRKRQVGSLTEVKFENTINRQTAVANPRQIERVIRGAQFNLDLVYEVVNQDEAVEDMQLLAEGMKYLQFDYIGGHGSRGYGKIKFSDITAETVIGTVDDETIKKINEVFSDF